MEPGPNGGGLAYQDDDFDICQVQVNVDSLENLSWADEQCSIVPASVVDDLRKLSEDALDESDSNDEDENDQQYTSENGSPIIPNVDSDDKQLVMWQFVQDMYSYCWCPKFFIYEF